MKNQYYIYAHFKKTFGYNLSQIKLLKKDANGYPII